MTNNKENDDNEKYVVVKMFKDIKDKKRLYKVNDEYPHKDSKIKLTKKRIEELSTTNNKKGKVFIKKVEEIQDEKVLEAGEEIQDDKPPEVGEESQDNEIETED